MSEFEKTRPGHRKTAHGHQHKHTDEAETAKHGHPLGEAENAKPGAPFHVGGAYLAKAADPMAADDGMQATDAPAEPAQMVAELTKRITAQADGATRAVNLWQDILRRRQYAPKIKKALSAGKVAKPFLEKVKEMFVNHFEKVGDEILEHAELAPVVGTAIKGTKEVKEIVDANAEAKDAKSEQDAIRSIVNVAERGITAARDRAIANIGALPWAQLPALYAKPPAPVNEPAIVGKLDALLLRALLDAGAVDMQEIKARRADLGDEITDAQQARAGDEGEQQQ